MRLQNRITSTEDDGRSSWVLPGPGSGQKTALRAPGMPTELTDPSIMHLQPGATPAAPKRPWSSGKDRKRVLNHRQARRLIGVGGGLFVNAGSLPPIFCDSKLEGISGSPHHIRYLRQHQREPYTTQKHDRNTAGTEYQPQTPPTNRYPLLTDHCLAGCHGGTRWE